jgi:ribosome biogenesis GTPase
MTSPETREGLVVRAKGADYFSVMGADEVRCALGGRFRLGESPEEVLPVVGDIVVVRMEQRTEARGPRGLIVGIRPRKSIFARTDSSKRMNYRVLGANLDRVILVFAARRPDLNPRLLDRMLVAAERGNIVPVICVNKMDLAASREEVEAALAPYRRIGYSVLLSSAVTGEGLAELKVSMVGALSILAGPSGSGKTSLIGLVQPGLELRIADGCTKAGKGRHTTSHFELHRLDGGGYLGDTPGVREFGVWGVTKRTLGTYFREFDEVRRECRFAGCTHSHEPDCAVKLAVEGGQISSQRYESYRRMLETVPDA